MNERSGKFSEKMLSGYIDGELTQQERQQVEIHCETCEETRQTLNELRRIREEVAGTDLNVYGEDKWRETMNDTTVKVSRGIGWLLLVGGLLALGAIVLYEFWFSSGEVGIMKLIVAAIYGGLFVLFISVLRQRLIERKTDKYKDVEI